MGHGLHESPHTVALVSEEEEQEEEPLCIECCGVSTTHQFHRRKAGRGRGRSCLDIIYNPIAEQEDPCGRQRSASDSAATTLEIR